MTVDRLRMCAAEWEDDVATGETIAIGDLPSNPARLLHKIFGSVPAAVLSLVRKFGASHVPEIADRLLRPSSWDVRAEWNDDLRMSWARYCVEVLAEDGYLTEDGPAGIRLTDKGLELFGGRNVTRRMDRQY